jgi:hypothetical protein
VTVSRDTAFAKIKARVDSTAMAARVISIAAPGIFQNEYEKGSRHFFREPFSSIKTGR